MSMVRLDMVRLVYPFFAKKYFYVLPETPCMFDYPNMRFRATIELADKTLKNYKELKVLSVL